MRHELKIWPEFYSKVLDGSKTFEVRKTDDRNFKEGDTVFLKEYDWDTKKYCASIGLLFEIGYILDIGNNHVVFSLLTIKDKPTKG